MATASVSDDDGDDGDGDEPSDAQGTTDGTVGDTERDGEGAEFYADTGELADEDGWGDELQEPELDQPLYPGCEHTQREVVFALVQREREGQVRDNTFSDLMWLFRHLLPAGNTLPTSWHIVRKLLGCRALSKFERHACVNCCMSWPHIAREDAIKHKGDKCTECSEGRLHVRESIFTHKTRARLGSRLNGHGGTSLLRILCRPGITIGSLCSTSGPQQRRALSTVALHLRRLKGYSNTAMSHFCLQAMHTLQ